MPFKVRNFTPHPVHIYDAEDLAKGPYLTLPSEGSIRVDSDPGVDMGTIELNGEIVAVRTPYKMKQELVGLPTLADGEFAIVSAMAYEAATPSLKSSLLMVDSDLGAVRLGPDGLLRVGGKGEIKGTVRLLGLA